MPTIPQLKQQIQQAEASGDYQRARRLKSQWLRQHRQQDEARADVEERRPQSGQDDPLVDPSHAERQRNDLVRLVRDSKKG